MGEKDIVSKEAVRHLAIDLAVNLLDLEFAHRNETVRQYLIYIGGDPLRMPAGLERESL
jgi:hypothetical protein